MTTPAPEQAETAVCRGCGRALRGKPYHMGGEAYLPLPEGGRAKVNHYGGYVCSRQCDFNAALRLEQSMPGHDGSQRSPGCYDHGRLDEKWENWP